MSGVFVFVAYFWVHSTGCSGEFCLVFKHFQNLENLISNIFEGKIAYLLPCNLRIAQCKQPRLVEPWCNFHIQSSGTALLEAIDSY